MITSRNYKRVKDSHFRSTSIIRNK